MKIDSVQSRLVDTRISVARFKPLPDVPTSLTGPYAHVMEETEQRLQQLEENADRFQWDSNTDLDEASEDLRRSRNKHVKSGLLRFGAIAGSVTLLGAGLHLAIGGGPIPPAIHLVAMGASVGLNHLFNPFDSLQQAKEDKDLLRHLQDWKMVNLSQNKASSDIPNDR